MSEKRQWRDYRGGSWTAYAYTRDEIAEAWHKDGQGHREAVERGRWCVVLPCTRTEALALSAMFLRHFAIPTCVTYDGETISMFCGNAGACDVANLKRDVWLMASGFLSGAQYPDENGPLFAQNAP